jgi:hypothetical protein
MLSHTVNCETNFVGLRKPTLQVFLLTPLYYRLEEIDRKHTILLIRNNYYEKAEQSSVARRTGYLCSKLLSRKETTGLQWVRQHRKAFCIMVYSQQETLIKMV